VQSVVSRPRSAFLSGAPFFHGVPRLSTEHIVARDTDVLRLLSAIDGASAAVGTVAVFGMGGAGKSVLCALLAHHPLTRERFPDGVFWITAGQVCLVSVGRPCSADAVCRLRRRRARCSTRWRGW
jgi:hypothetical protein